MCLKLDIIGSKVLRYNYLSLSKKISHAMVWYSILCPQYVQWFITLNDLYTESKVPSSFFPPFLLFVDHVTDQRKLLYFAEVGPVYFCVRAL